MGSAVLGTAKEEALPEVLSEGGRLHKRLVTSGGGVGARQVLSLNQQGESMGWTTSGGLNEQRGG